MKIKFNKSQKSTLLISKLSNLMKILIITIGIISLFNCNNNPVSPEILTNTIYVTNNVYINNYTNYYYNSNWNKTTYFLNKNIWNLINPINVNFIQNSKTIFSTLKITNDSSNLYILLYISNDNFYLGKNENGEWADDRLWIYFDELNDKMYTPTNEDMLSLFSRDFLMENTNWSTMCAAQGDWYYENDVTTWEYSLELNWEISNISSQRFNGGPDVKEVYFYYSKKLINNLFQDFMYEFKIPINSIDPYDLQTTVGQTIGLRIIYGNIADGYGEFPDNISTNMYEYNLK